MYDPLICDLSRTTETSKKIGRKKRGYVQIHGILPITQSPKTLR